MTIDERRVLDFLTKNRVGVLSVLLKDGSPHGATVHFSHQIESTKLFFLTDRTYKKCEALLEGAPVRASFVVGFSEEEMKTLQLDGVVRIVSDAQELVVLKEIHFKKIPTAKEYENDLDSVFLEFVPTWWRYTDYNTKPETIIES
ncbi:MAG: pyridoxamine 5'-phosphate oxidase family protein [bacterium]|nr:pyridoxamine 5'-phosphate oxidase family protein [bacterium]